MVTTAVPVIFGDNLIGVSLRSSLIYEAFNDSCSEVLHQTLF